MTGPPVTGPAGDGTASARGAAAGDAGPGAAGGPGGGTRGRALSPAEVKRQWERIKREERAGAPGGPAPPSSTASPRRCRRCCGHRASGRARPMSASIGKWPSRSSTRPTRRSPSCATRSREGDPGRIEEEIGDLLFTVANAARKLRVDPESALRTANAKFTRRFRAVEQRLESRGRTLHDALARRAGAGVADGQERLLHHGAGQRPTVTAREEPRCDARVSRPLEAAVLSDPGRRSLGPVPSRRSGP